ncbi:MAG: hypothetical protein AAGI28_17085, partial [Pseudomonadota bacterium]
MARTCDGMERNELCGKSDCEMAGLCQRAEMISPYIAPEAITGQIIEDCRETAEEIVEFFNMPETMYDQSLGHAKVDQKKLATLPQQLSRFHTRWVGRFGYIDKQRRLRFKELDMRWLWFNPTQIVLEDGRDRSKTFEHEIDGAMQPAKRLSQWYWRNLARYEPFEAGSLIRYRERWSVIATLLSAWHFTVHAPYYEG